MTRLPRAWSTLGLVALAGCSIPLADTSALVANRCESASDCGGQVCYPLSWSNTCVATKGELEGVILEVRPTQGAGYGAGASHLFPLDRDNVLLSGSAPGGFVVPHDLTLPELVQIAPGKVTVAEGFKPTPCLAADGSLPVSIELRPVTHYVGLTLPTIAASTAPYSGGAESYSFDVAVPPGEYDVRVVPFQFATEEERAAAGCTPPPPLFLGNQSITHDVGVVLEMPTPSRMTGTLTLPEGVNLEGYTLDMVEPTLGNVISTAHVLSSPTPTDPPTSPPTVQAAFEVLYQWVDTDSSPIIRLRPPEGALAPRVYWDFASAAIFGDKDVPLTLGGLDLTPKHIQATVLDADNKPVLATLTIQSKGLSGEAGANASYTVTTETGPDGQFEADLLLGTYRILARPKADPTKALTLTEWTIKEDDLCCGRVVSVGDKVNLRGTVSAPGAQALSDSPVVAEPPLPQPSNFLAAVLGLDAVLPDKVSAFPDSSGAFVLGVDPDPGSADFSVDFSVRPPSGSGYPWLVRPRVKVQSLGTNLGALTVPYPTVLTGTIRDPNGNPVGPAVVRAFLPLPNEEGSGTLSGTVIQIAEADVSETGSYILTLPPSIAK